MRVFYSEKTIRLPDTFWCYEPLVETAGVNALPALSNGYVTFGCFNNFVKVTPYTLDLWARVLAEISGSRLLVMSQPGSHRVRVLDHFARKGVAADRIAFVGRTPMTEYFKLYHRVDVCLDTFPYNGHTTTLDGLWMGVPVVTMEGTRAAARGGVSLLNNVGLADYIAKDEEGFVALASKKSRDLDALSATRTSLRQTMLASPLTDGKRFATAMEKVFADVYGRK